MSDPDEDVVWGQLVELLTLARPRLREGGVTVTESSDLIADLGLDSLAMWDVIVAVEDRFQIQIAEQDLEGLRTFGDVVRLVREKTGC